MISRRSLIRGVGALLAAPAIVRASSLMPVRAIIEHQTPSIWLIGWCDMTEFGVNRYGTFSRAVTYG